ncbi:MAG: YIP1 family protein [Deltaproteobacteria bacterium]|nr:YIP1 family protein [Deltaproteobacteria bacterium]
MTKKIRSIQDLKDFITGRVPVIVRQVITDPSAFYGNMETSGGFEEPVAFVAVMSVALVVINLILALLGLGYAGPASAALISILIGPVVALLMSFAAAAIFFIIWRLMGSVQSFETAYRCIAYAGSIAPLTAILGIIPYLGSIAGLAWTCYIFVTASTEVHRCPRQKAVLVFAIIFVILALLSVGSQRTARKFEREMKFLEREAGKPMSYIAPDEARNG